MEREPGQPVTEHCMLAVHFILGIFESSLDEDTPHEERMIKAKIKSINLKKTDTAIFTG